MSYGLRTPEVVKFIASLGNLREDEWDASIRRVVMTSVNLEADDDNAAVTIVRVAQGSGVWQELVAARADTAQALRALSWSDSPTLDRCASLAVGAIVVMDRAPFNDIFPAFRAFLETSVLLPIQRTPS